MSRKPLISIAIPAYNEAENIPELWRRLTAMFQGLDNEYDFEVVVCENGSHDNSYEKLMEIRLTDSRLKIVRLSRNFHMEGGMMAALSQVTGDACVIMSADLQDPPEMILDMIELYKAGFLIINEDPHSSINRAVSCLISKLKFGFVLTQLPLL